MFDRPPSAPDAQVSVDRLCALYDRLMADVEAGRVDALTAQASVELRAMARIYDLDTTGTDADVWRELRAVLAQGRPVSSPVSRIASDTGVEALTLMLVEDDPETAADLTEVLSGAGHRVVGPFHHAEAAEAAAALHDVDLALLDINLSGETSGVELARSLKGRWGVRVLFLTGDDIAATRHADLAEGLVLKPYSGREVLDAIGRVAAA